MPWLTLFVSLRLKSIFVHMSTYTKYSLNKLEIKNDLSNFGEVISVKHKPKIHAVARSAKKIYSLSPPPPPLP